MEKLNIAELLKDCPKGMELYSPLCGECKLGGVIQGIIHVKTNSNKSIAFYSNGRYIQDGECVLFPSKENRDWSTFQRPFKDGDIVIAEDAKLFQMFILKEVKCHENDSYDGDCYFGWDFEDNDLFGKGVWGFNRLASEEEKQKLFDAIKANGYKWNPETKTLEKLIVPKFKVGDRIKSKDSYTNYCNGNHIFTITEIRDGKYWSNRLAIEYIENQDDWELVPNKFDITTLKPFESKVLVRTNNRKWVAAFYSHYDKESLLHHCVVGGLWYEQCVPYNGNEHLLDTTNDCDEYYKTWK